MHGPSCPLDLDPTSQSISPFDRNFARILVKKFSRIL